jgi:diguanylate cyclase (GGDEF)-like protein
MNKRARVLAGGLLALAVLAVLADTLLGAPTEEQHGRVVTVGVYENAPKVYTDSNGKPAGLFMELLRNMAQRDHWSLRFVHCTWSECLNYLAAGKIDLMPDVAFSPSRAKRFDFHNVPVAFSWSQVYRRQNIQIRSIQDLAGRNVAVLRGSIQQHFLDRLMKGSKLHFRSVLVNTYAKGFQEVRDGRADAVVSNTFFGRLHARSYGLIETPIMFEPVSLYFATGKGRNAQLLHRIDLDLISWRNNPESVYFTALRHAMAPAPVTIVPRWLRISLFTAAGGLVVLLVFAAILRWQVRRATAERDSVNRRMDQVLSASPVVLYLARREGNEAVTNWVSPNVQRVFGFTPNQVAAPGWWQAHMHPEDREAAVAALAQLYVHGRLTQEYRILDAAGNIRHIRDELRMAGEIGGHHNQIVGTWSDLTESREQAAQVSFLTNHDPLTRLPNRVLLHQRLEALIAWARRTHAEVPVLSIDLDRFKNINDTLGHNVGDQLLCEAAHKLESIVGPQDTLARVGGDEFVLVVGGNRTLRHAAKIARQILGLFAVPLRAGQHEYVATASVGIGLFPRDGEDADTLLKHTELALYEAKAQGRNTYRIFASELSAELQERLTLENALRGAAARGELELHYQPQIDLRTGSLVGVEALVRWNHPQLGLVAPGRFIPLAEETGIINELGAWILQEACQQIVHWEQQDLYVPRIAVNLSVQQIDQELLPDQVSDVLRMTGISGQRLELEITESTIMHEPDKAVFALSAVKMRGVMVSVDDFGTGHSSLAYLKRLPLDRLKIDQSFVHDIGRDTNDEAISRAVIDLARSLGLETVAEGVERKDQVEFLRAAGCEFAQGYLFSQPVRADELRQAWNDYTNAQAN